MPLQEEDFAKLLKKFYQQLPHIDFNPDTLINTRLLRNIATNATCYYNRLLTRYHLHETLHYALILLYNCKDKQLQPSDLSRILDLTRTSATRLADEMVKNGWVIRTQSRNDRRVVLLTLTQSGIEVIESITPKLAKAREAVWQDFSEEEIKTMQTLLRKLNDSVMDKLTTEQAGK